MAKGVSRPKGYFDVYSPVSKMRNKIKAEAERIR